MGINMLIFERKKCKKGGFNNLRKKNRIPDQPKSVFLKCGSETLKLITAL